MSTRLKVVIIGVCIASGIANAEWIVNETPIERGHISTIEVGKGRGDDTNRVYIGMENMRIFEYTYSNGEWNLVDTLKCPESHCVMHITIGDARNEGVSRLYAAAAGWDGKFYEFWYSGTSWNRLKLSDGGGHCVIGKGRNDGKNYLYGPGDGGPCEYNWNGSNWIRTQLSDSIIDWIMDVGIGRNDDTIRLYGFDERSWPDSNWFVEWTWNGSSYSRTLIEETGGFINDICVGDGRGDGVVRIYSVWLTPTRFGSEYTYNSNTNSWEHSSNFIYPYQLWRVCIGKLKSDGKSRLYTRYGGTVYEIEWDGTDWDCDTVVNIDGVTKASLAIGCGRNDDTMRLYFATGGNWPPYKLYEITNTDPYVIDTIGIEEREEMNGELQMTEIKICPNPFVHSTVVSYSFLVIRKNQRIEIKTYDLGGRLVEKVYLKTNNQQLTTEIGKNLVPGIYFVKLKAGNKVWRKKVTKIR
jgi:hypothetical protein